MTILKNLAGAIIAAAAIALLAGCEVNPTRPTNVIPEPSGSDTTVVIKDTCATVIVSSQTFATNAFTLGSPGTKQTLFEGTLLCDGTNDFMFVLTNRYLGADGNVPPPLAVWLRDVHDRYTAVPCTWNGTRQTSLQLPNASGTYVDTAYVTLRTGVDFPPGTAVTAYIRWGAASSPALVQPASLRPIARPLSALWHYEGNGTFRQSCLADTCWSDTTITITRR
ncbi:MAG: hypothetical protein HY976_02060 [Candidatus Kerfeldbacteria bacterium]|nr:hypothetical protein [Candidatus Kerfeldbacteria bacterium]